MGALIHVLRQIDVGDSLQLERVGELLGDRDLTRGSTVLRGPEASPSGGVVLGHEPLDLKLGRVAGGSFTSDVRVRLFEFGVVAFRFTFEAAELLEDFTVFVLPRIPDSELGTDRMFAHIVLGEPATQKLAPSMVQELSRRVIRYYEDDLVLVDYDAAIVVGEEGAADLVDIFEIASAQLLELRFYDGMLGRSLRRLLKDVRRARTTVWLFRNPFRELARRAAILALELVELRDRLERAITLVGDTHSALVYRETAVRFRLAESGGSVREKVEMIGRISELLGQEIHSRRDLALEILILVLIAIEVLIAVRQ